MCTSGKVQLKKLGRKHAMIISTNFDKHRRQHLKKVEQLENFKTSFDMTTL
jgi:hypothetical protein